jgi:CBS domain-containing protein
MLPIQIQSYVMREKTPAVYAYYFLKTAALYPIVLVCDDNDALIGIICNEDLNRLRQMQAIDLSVKNVGEVCNRDFSAIRLLPASDTENEDFIYREARNIFAEKRIDTLPVVDREGLPRRLFGRFQAFFADKWEGLPYAHYAHCLWETSKFAKSRGYVSISAIEFGVGGGSGLVLLELYAKEISKLTGIGIEVYGFDSGAGLFPPADYRDVTQIWMAGEYKMDFEKLQSRLYRAKLIMGDICKTSKTFWEEYNPAPVGVMLVDVDQYTPTVAILDMFNESDEHFLPIVQMYFDDIDASMEFQGENLAIKEFNAKSKHCKISPESFSESRWGNLKFNTPKIKQCFRFTHEKLVNPSDSQKRHIGLIT